VSLAVYKKALNAVESVIPLKKLFVYTFKLFVYTFIKNIIYDVFFFGQI